MLTRSIFKSVVASYGLNFRMTNSYCHRYIQRGQRVGWYKEADGAHPTAFHTLSERDVTKRTFDGTNSPHIFNPKHGSYSYIKDKISGNSLTGLTPTLVDRQRTFVEFYYQNG